MKFLKFMLFFVFVMPNLLCVATADSSGSFMVFYVGCEKAVVNQEIKSIDENNSNVIMKLKENRAFLPLRFVGENSGGVVDWNEAESKAIISIGTDKIEIIKGSDRIIKNNKDVQIDVPAFEENSRLYIPVRAVNELLGKYVLYERGLVVVSDTEEYLNSITQIEIDKYIMKLTGINIVGDKNTFDKLIKDNSVSMSGGGGSYGAVAEDAVKSVERAVPAQTVENSGFSDTNTQVSGVDEADIIKTDGTYIYKIANNKLYIIQAVPADDLKQLSALEFLDFNISDMYIDEDRFILIGSSVKYEPQVYDSAKPQLTERIISPRYIDSSNTEVRVYNSADKSAPKLERSLILEGSLLSSRKIGNALYTVSNKYFWYGNIAAPVIKDKGKEFSIDYSKMYYFHDTNINNFIIVTGIDIESPEKQVSTCAFLGSGNNIYVSQENMYITYDSYPSTDIFKFAISGGDVQFLSKGRVEGTVKDQFSMDEYDGYFRIATTSYTNKEINNVYIFNQSMQEVSKITDIAPGERIYSVRYMGNTGYMVTFRQVDPLFVIDLNPESPKILGQLKIPGYSEYLHPFKEGYVIGFGKDATQNGLYKGIKIALFDASDPVNPKELFVEYIGDRGTNSPVLNNHKALMIMPELNMFALPIELYEAEQQDAYDNLTYGSFTYQGGFVYKLTIENGFELDGKVTHLSSDDYLKSGMYGGDSNKYVDRILYIDGVIYFASNQFITSHSTLDYGKISEIELK